MSTNDAVYALLSAQSGITDLVGTRIWRTFIPQNSAFPCVRFEVSDDGGLVDFDGQGDTLRTELQTDCIAATSTQAEAIAAALVAALKNYSGAMGERNVQRVSLTSEYHTYEPNLAEGKYRASQAWVIWHN